MKKLIKSTIMAGTMLSYGASTVLAGPSKETIGLCDPKGTNNLIVKSICNFSLGKIIVTGIELAMVGALLICFVWLVWGGIKWIMASGDKTGTQAAKDQVTNALLGLFVVFVAWALLSIVGTFFGVETGILTLPTLTTE